MFMDGKPFMPTRRARLPESRRLSGQQPRTLRRVPQPRNFLAELSQHSGFAGGPNPEGEGWCRTSRKKGRASGAKRTSLIFLETGQTPDGGHRRRGDVRVIKNTSQLAPEDRAAIAEYVKSLPPVEGRRAKKAKKDDDKS